MHAARTTEHGDASAAELPAHWVQQLGTVAPPAGLDPPLGEQLRPLPLEELRVRGHIIGHARNNMYANLSHAWL